MIKNIIFDLDGTLLYTLEDLTDSLNSTLIEFRYKTCSIEQVKSYVGDGVKLLLIRAINQEIEQDKIEKMLIYFKNKYSQNMTNKTKPYSGIIDTLKTLKEKKYKISVVSNKFDSAVKDLCDLYFPDLIDIAIGENEKLGIHKKPSADGIFLAIKELQCKIDETIYVGDSDVDIKTANNAKIPCISVCWGFRDKNFLIKNGAKIIIDKPQQILDII